MKTILTTILIMLTYSSSGLPAEAALPRCGEVPRRLTEKHICQVQNAYREHAVPAHRVLSQKKELAADDFKRWNDVLFPGVSDDGEWVAYTLSTAAGVADLVVRGTRSKIEYRVSRGYISPSLFGGVQWQRHLRHTRFTADSRFVVFLLAHDVEARRPAKETPHDWSLSDGDQHLRGVGMLDLKRGTIMEIPGAMSFALPGNAGRHFAYVLANPSQGKTLVLHDLQSGLENRIEDVKEFVFEDGGRYLAYTVSSVQQERNGAYVRRLADGHTIALLRGPGDYRHIIFDVKGAQIAFLSTHADHNPPQARYSVYHASSPLTPVTPVVRARSIGGEWLVSAEQRTKIGHDSAGPWLGFEPNLKFTRDGGALLFSLQPEGILPPQAPDAKEVSLELLHWQEPQALPQARRSGTNSRYLAIYHIAERRLVQLGSTAIPEVSVTENGRFAVGLNSAPYRLENIHGRPAADLYLLDAMDGASRLLRKKARLQAIPENGDQVKVALSPGGRYALYFEEARWWSVDLVSRETVDLTGHLLPEVHFDGKMLRSGGDSGSAIGIGGWLGRDQRVLLYSSHDVWEVDPAGRSAPRSITAGLGKKENMVFRLWEDFSLALDPAWGSGWRQIPRFAPFIDPAQPILLSALDTDTMSSGIWLGQVDANKKPQTLMMADKKVTPVAKARHASQYLLTQETFAQYPDLWTGRHFGALQRISDANPQQAEYRWGDSQLIRFTSDAGVPLKGRLYRPEGFDSSKQYPMIVSIYEIASQELHTYASPRPLHAPMSASRNWPEAVSRGYLYFVPDILSTAPYPGQSAVAAVVPAVKALINQGYVDPKRIGLSGFSFGGYEVNYLITQTNIFRCAVSGAGPSNLLSLYGMRSNGAAHHETGQGKQGGSIWERPFVYLVNSPLLHADKVTTPLLINHNDGETNVPFAQGLEFFHALRRNGKLVWLLNYKGEDHGLIKEANQRDFDHRVREFFDHYLRDEPLPAWMGDGSDGTVISGEEFGMERTTKR